MNPRLTEYHTNFIEQSGQRQIIFQLEEQSGFSPVWLIDYFEKTVAEGRHFMPDETVQIGWMTVMLKPNEAGNLEVWEPQFDSLPIKWIRGANNTIRHLVLQKSLADLLKVEPDFPSLRQAGLASRAFLTATDSSDFHMTRGASKANDSGWCFDTPLRSGDNAEFRSLFELSFHRTGIVPFLALPSGSTVSKKYDQLVVDMNGKTISSLQNDFLHELSKTLIWI